MHFELVFLPQECSKAYVRAEMEGKNHLSCFYLELNVEDSSLLHQMHVIGIDWPNKINV
jgi:hypothetical protein